MVVADACSSLQLSLRLQLQMSVSAGPGLLLSTKVWLLKQLQPNPLCRLLSAALDHSPCKAVTGRVQAFRTPVPMGGTQQMNVPCRLVTARCCTRRQPTCCMTTLRQAHRTSTRQPVLPAFETLPGSRLAWALRRLNCSSMLHLHHGPPASVSTLA